MAEETIEGVNPTRMELLAIKKKKKLAQKGHKLLTEKRDALVVNLFEIIESRNKLRGEMEGTLAEAYGALVEAELIMGKSDVAEIGLGVPEIQSIPMQAKNIMGVRVPSIDASAVQRGEGLLYGYYDTTSKLDEAVEKFNDALARILELSEVEGALQNLAVEIEKTKRRVNALEHIFIPRLGATEKYIEMHLEEREREDFIRRKHIKASMEN